MIISVPLFSNRPGGVEGTYFVNSVLTRLTHIVCLPELRPPQPVPEPMLRKSGQAVDRQGKGFILDCQ